MKDRRWMVLPISGVVGFAVALLGTMNYRWSHMPVFPVYGYTLDLIAAPVLLGLALFARRIRLTGVDEFVVAKKRMASQFGMIFGLVAFILLTFLPFLVPHSYHSFLSSIGSAEDVYTVGHIVGMAPFGIGALVGMIVSWAKYR